MISSFPASTALCRRNETAALDESAPPNRQGLRPGIHQGHQTRKGHPPGQPLRRDQLVQGQRPTPRDDRVQQDHRQSPGLEAAPTSRSFGSFSVAVAIEQVPDLVAGGRKARIDFDQCGKSRFGPDPAMVRIGDDDLGGAHRAEPGQVHQAICHQGDDRCPAIFAMLRLESFRTFSNFPASPGLGHPSKVRQS